MSKLNRKLVLVAAAFASLPSSPGTAAMLVGKAVVQQKPEPVTSALQALAEVDAEKLVGDKLYAAKMVRHIEAVEPVIADKDVLHAMLAMKTIAYVTLDKSREAIAVSDRMRQERPHEARSYIGAWNGYLMEERVDDVLSSLQQAASAVSDPGEQADLHELIHEEGISYLNFAVSKDADKARRERMAEALATIGWPGSRDAETRDFFRLAAAEAKLKRGDIPGAAAIATRIDAPGPLIELLVDRRFDQAFTPSADRTHLIRSALAREDKLSLEALTAAPGNLNAMLRRAQFLRSVGRDAEVLPLVQPLTSDMDQVEQSGSKAFWIVNEAAYSLVSLGRGDDAVELMDRLLKIDIESNPDLINMSINKGAILNELGMHEDAFRHVSEIEISQAKYASPFGMMWIAANAACALAAEDKPEEARSWLNRLKDKSEDNRAAATMAMLCLDDLDSAEELLLKRLSEDDRSTILVGLQKYEISGKSSAMSPLTAARWELLLQRPRVKAAIEKVGRIISIPAARTYWGAF